MFENQQANAKNALVPVPKNAAVRSTREAGGGNFQSCSLTGSNPTGKGKKKRKIDVYTINREQ